jgi:hypothetical protein
MNTTPRPATPPRSLLLAAVAAAVGAIVTPAFAAESCSVSSAATAPAVVELYTSEGCNSCPPADRWLSGLKADPSVVALAFHVDYWDRLGWTDRFASHAYTQRQAEQQATNGARFSYTPQVVVNGRDRTDWPALRAPLPAQRSPSAVEVNLQRVGAQVTATVSTRAGAPAQLAAYWAVTEQDHASAVQAGENAGVTLHHDYVVRDYRPVAAWATGPGVPHAVGYTLPSGAGGSHARTVNLVIVDAANGRPVQAVKSAC